MIRILAVAAAALFLTACASRAPAPSVATHPPKAAAGTTPPTDALAEYSARYPASRERLATTDGGIYLGNLDARVDGLRAVLARDDDPRLRAALANAMLQRWRIVGRLEDGETALSEAWRALAIAPDLADARVVQGAALSAFHRFGEARSALEAASGAGADPTVVARVRRDLDVAEGRYAELRGELAGSREPAPDFYELAHRADLRVLLGDLGGASLHYRTAQDLFADTSPMQLAWLYVQQGIALLRFGEVAGARRFFAAARERLPAYYLASEHLAECEYLLGDLDAARVLYREVIAQTGDPEFEAALAEVERAAGDAEAATMLDRRAEAGYRARVARHRAAYAQHFAEFLLERGRATEALALARENAGLRPDIGSLILLARAADAAGDAAFACDTHARIKATGLTPPELADLDPLSKRCAAL